MPFTFSHPAAILPLKYLPKRWFSLTGLVIGSMTPDFEYFIRIKVESRYSHTWTGLFWFDTPLALLLLYVYNIFIKDKLIDHLPLFLNKRFSGFKNSGKPNTRYYLFIIILSVLIGAATHIFWDDFTHPEGYFVKHIRLLKHHVFIFGHSFLLYNILQHLSSFIGAVIIAIAVYMLPVGKSTRLNHILYYWMLLTFIVLIILSIRLFTGLNWQQYGDVIVTCISGFFIGLIITSIISPSTETSIQV